MMKVENDPEIAQLIEVAERVLAERSEKQLADHERAILAHVLAGEPLKTAKAGCYKPGTIVKQLAPKLWNRLGEEVRCKNVRLFLENAADRFQADPSITESQEDDASISATVADSPPAVDQDSPKRILHNLPQRQYRKFVGRRQEREKLLKLLMPKHPTHRIHITGMGGVGKTSLALDCAYRCLYASSAPEPATSLPTFDLIIFVSAKQQALDSRGLHRRRVHQSTDLIRQIVDKLDRMKLLTDEFTATSFEEQIDLIYRVLERYQTLLILDNLEAVENRQDINDFLLDLPSSVKSILTAREGTNSELQLTGLPEEDGLSLVQLQAEDNGLKLSSERCKAVYNMTDGLPLAIGLVVGQLCQERSIKRIEQELSQPTGDLVQYCFKSSVESIQNQSAYWLLLTTTLFPESVSRDMLISVAIPNDVPTAAEDAVEQLRTLSLINQEYVSEIHSRYRIVAPLRAYLRLHLQAHPEFEKQARQRQLCEYVKFSEQYADQYAGEWRGKFEGLDQEWENIQEVAKWAIENEQYAELLQLWQNLKSYFYMVGRGANGIRFWLTGLKWAEWLTEAALKQEDKSNAGALLFFRAWVQMQIGTNYPNIVPQKEEQAVNSSNSSSNPNKSTTDELLELAWEFREHQSQKDQANIARQIGLLKIRQRQFDEAHKWLERSEQILENASLEQRKYLECRSHTRYYQGRAYLRTQNFEDAKLRLEEACTDAKEVKLDRLVRHIETSLAEVAIHQRAFKLAKTLLDQGLQIAKIEADRGYLAIVKHLQAKLAHEEGNVAKKRREANESIQIYEQLGRFTEAKEVRTLLDSNSSTNR